MPAPLITIPLRAYLRMRATSCVTPDGTLGLVLTLRDTGGLLPDGITAVWIGPEAAAFLERNQAELSPGRCLDLEIFHLRCVNAAIRARVKTCRLAPLAPSWIKQAKRDNHP